MARNLMAVCVVCLLCAEHLPCKEHLENSYAATTTNLVDLETPEQPDSSKSNTLNGKSTASKLTSNDEFRIENTYNKPKGRTKTWLSEKSSRIRSKRHAHHSHHHDDERLSSNEPGNVVSKDFLKKIFQQFGNTDGESMDLNGFEKMLTHLKLYNLIEDRLQKNETNNKLQKPSSSVPPTTSNESCISSLDLVNRMSSTSSSNPLIIHDHERSDVHEEHHEQQAIETIIASATNSKQNDTIANEHTDNDVKSRVFVSSNDLYNICPILLYQLIAPTSLEKSGCIASDLIPKYTEKPLEELIEIENRLSVWLYAVSSVLGVSLVGLLGVAVIPCMDRHFYQHVIQFLVALAVGTLAGDALLHLLPHAMITLKSFDEGHSSMTWKGLIAVLGIVFFFATERGLTMIAEWRKKIEKQEKPSSRVRVMRDPDSASMNNSVAADKLCKDRYNSYPYCYNEIAMETKDDHYHHHNQKSSKELVTSGTPPSKKKTCNNTYNNSCSENNIVRDTKDHGDHNENAQKLLQSIDVDGDRDKVRPYREETYTIILREHESSHHGHSHKHGHVHSPPSSLSAVAWMVVMGDGLHNFTDGMAIGAAFSSNIAGGFSTAIAVFCHELPHELGDFAVLLKAGMTAKQAVYYNLLSSVLSFLGMILGIIIGDTPDASAWVFACAAGMFLYIALVDMMPELTSAHNERCALSQCVLQLLGMITGLGIMLVIALFEEDLKSIF